MSIPNELFGLDMAYLFELAKGHTQLLLPDVTPVSLPVEIARDPDEIFAKRKLTKILRPNASSLSNVGTSDQEQVFIEHENEKRCKQSSPRIFLFIDIEAGAATLPGSGNCKVHAAPKDSGCGDRRGV